MRSPEPVLIGDLFPAERAQLLDLLAALPLDHWHAPTACAGWSVKDIAAHLLGDDLGRLARQRDSFTDASLSLAEPLVAFINRRNAEWIQALRRLSAPVLCDLLRWSGEQTATYFASLDPFALGGPVSWAGPDSAPVWLDLAREYTERWHHQQHIREAVGAPGLTASRYFAPVLATFVWALPHTFRHTTVPSGTAIHLTITGASGGAWVVVCEDSGWTLYSGAAPQPAATVTLDQETAWRLFTKGVSPQEASSVAHIEGDPRLGAVVLETVAIIA
ncbi:MAG: maleylpyruvate isomerase family mycothiol-dependent enzyme [Thermomicrobiales bacterium]